MSVQFAILGLLASGPRTGYDLKKLLAEAEALPWSGNSNQVYPALVQLHREGLVEQEPAPSGESQVRKVYAMTGAGREALRQWLTGEPEPTQVKSPFVVRLAGADVLSLEELERLIAGYEEQQRMKLIILEEIERRGTAPSLGSPRQQAIWRHINGHARAMLRAEREWLLTLQWALARLPAEEREP